MNLGIISDESRSDDMKAKRDALRAPDCDCINDVDLCETCQEKLAGYDMLRLRHRALAHGIASVLGNYGAEMPVEARGKLRVLFTEQALPELPEWSRSFWNKLAEVVYEEITEKGWAEV